MISKQVDYCFIVGVIPLVPPSGGEKVVFELVKGLIERGFTVAIVVMNRNWLKEYLSEKYNIPKNRIKLYANLRTMLYHKIQRRTIIKLIAPIIRKVKNIDYDFSFMDNTNLVFSKSPKRFSVECNYGIATWWGTSFFLADPHIKAEKKFYLIQNHEDDPSFSGKLSTFAADSYKLPIIKIAVSQSLMKRFKDDKPSRILVGFDSKYYNFPGDVSTKLRNSVLIHLGFSEYKGARNAIEAANIIHDYSQKIKLVAFGTFDHRAVPDYIEYHFQCSNSELLKLYTEASIFLFPSIVEGFALTPLEAMSCGCAVVSTRNQGAEELIDDGINGVLVNQNSPGSLANGVISLIEKDDLRISIGNAGKETAEKYSYENMLKSFIEAIKKNDNYGK